MTSHAQAKAPLENVQGLAFLGFHLHPAGRPSHDRAEHLFDVKIPMLFLQGKRDTLASLDELQLVCRKLASLQRSNCLRAPIILFTCRRGLAGTTRRFLMRRRMRFRIGLMA